MTKQKIKTNVGLLKYSTVANTPLPKSRFCSLNGQVALPVDGEHQFWVEVTVGQPDYLLSKQHTKNKGFVFDPATACIDVMSMCQCYVNLKELFYDLPVQLRVQLHIINNPRMLQAILDADRN